MLLPGFVSGDQKLMPCRAIFLNTFLGYLIMQLIASYCLYCSVMMLEVVGTPHVDMRQRAKSCLCNSSIIN